MFGIFLKSQHCGTENSTYWNEDIEMVQYVAYQIIAPTLITAGILGNIINLIILTKPVFNECTQIYLRMLTIGDLLVLAFEISAIIRLNNLQSTSRTTAIFYAHFELALVTMFIAFNIYIILCLTFDRYVSICLPILFNSFHTKKRTIVAISVCFGIATVISTPLCVMKTTCYIEECDRWSFADNGEITKKVYWDIYLTTSEIFIRIAPAFILSVLNILIIRKFRAMRKRRHRSPRLRAINEISIRNLKKRYREERRMIILLQIVILLFFITMIPSSVLSLLYTEVKEDDFWFQTFRAVANLLEIANSSFNFFAYYLCSKDFRKNILGLFRSGSYLNNQRSTSNIKTDYNQSSNIGLEETGNNGSVTNSNYVNKF